MFSVNLLCRSKTILNHLCRGQSYLRPAFRLPVKVSQLQLSKTVKTLGLSKLPQSSPTLTRQIGATIGAAARSERIVGYWLLGCSGMVIVAVVLGGVTRLTESGLSVVTWNLFGEKVPWTDEDWNREFERYQQYPEFKLLKSNITLSEFKWIWWMEYGHRTWGRCIGAAFYIPAAIFWLKGYLTPALKKKVVLFGTLIAMQGLLGWYMVKSGLEDRFHEPSDIPRVSQYRLASHLALAFTLYTTMLYTAFGCLLPLQKVASGFANAKYLRHMAHLSKGLIFLTAISGAFVSGLDAGLVYNSFPKMGDNWVPEDIMSMSPKMINFTENPTTVQFDHRILGLTTLTLICALWALSRKYPLPPRVKTAVNALAGMGLIQVMLGISTLVHYVPTPLAATHQSGSLVLLSVAIWLTHELKYLKYLPK